jgi:uncharacterized membrane protein YfcA
VRALLASPLGFLIGLSLGGLGGGGSILAVPALVYVAGQSPGAAVGTSLVVVLLVALGGLVPHHRAGRVRVGPGLGFAAAGVGGSLAGTAANAAVDPDVLLLAFSGVMLVAAAAMHRRARNAARADDPGAASTVDTLVRVDRTVALRVAAVGTAVGALTGFFGVGGGFVVVPALVLTLHFSMPDAVGTSLLVIAANSAVALVARLGTGDLEWHVIIPFAVAGLAGVLTGSRLAERADARHLARAFSAALVLVALAMGARAAVAL